MKILIQFILLALATISHGTTTNPWRELIPDTKEIIYDYHANIKTGTRVPVPHYAKFLLDGKLHMQSIDNGLLLRLSDLTYTLYNGREDETMHEAKMLPIPATMTDMLTPFKIILNNSGKADELVTRQQEPEYSLNIKKAIGSIFQMDFDMVNLNSMKPHAFMSKEKTIFGPGMTLYNVMSEKDIVTVHKMHDMKSSHHLYQNMLTNFEPKVCEDELEEQISHDSQKIYTFWKQAEGQMLKRIECNGGIYNHPFQANSYAHYIFINQTFNLHETVQLQNRMELPTEWIHDNFEYILNEDSVPFEHVPDKQTLMPIVEKMLEEIVEFAQHMTINDKRPDFKKGQLINRIVQVLVHFDIDMLEKMHEQLEKKTTTQDLQMLDYFHNILPLIGTRHSMMFILNIVKRNTLSERIAMTMLEKMPFYVRFPNEKLIIDMDQMLRLTGVSWNIQKVAILSFSTLLHKLYIRNNRQFHDYFTHNSNVGQRTHDHDNTHIHVNRHNNLFEKYIGEFLNNIKSSTKFEEQSLYMNALLNMKTHHLIRHLEPAVRGELFNDDNLRYMAIVTIGSVLRYDRTKLFELFWPIFADRNLPTELRINAFYHIMKSRPSMSTYINIYWLMQNEPNLDLYQFYYTYMKSVSETTNPCLRTTKMNTKKLLKYLPKPYLHVLTHHGISDLTDTEFNFGNSIDWFYINTPKTQVLKIDLNMYAMNIWQTPLTALYVKIDGLDEAMLGNLKLDFKSIVKTFSVDELLRVFKNIQNNKNIKVEFLLMEHSQVVRHYYFDSTNIKTKFQHMMTEELAALKNYKDIFYNMFMKVFIPTEIGFPAVFDVLLPTLDYGSLNMVREITSKNVSLHVEGSLHSWNDGSMGLSLHNPLLNVWQGIKRYISYSYVLPIYFDMNVSPHQHTMDLSLRNPTKDSSRSRFHVANMVFIKDYLKQNILEKTSPSSKNWVVVAPSDTYLHKYSLSDDIEIYDTEHSLEYEKKIYESNMLNMYNSKNILALLNLETYWFLQPDASIRGIRGKVGKDTNENLMTSMDLSLRLDYKTLDNGSLISPAIKINADITCMIKIQDKTLPLSINTILNMNDGHTTNNLKMQIGGIIPGKYILLDGNKRFTDDGFTGNLIIARGNEKTFNNDDVVMNLTMIGEKLEEQRKNMHNYRSCRQDVRSMIRNIKPFSCVSDRSSIRKTIINIKMNNIADLKPLTSKVMKFTNSKYLKHYEHDKEPNTDLSSNDLKIILEYPMVDDIVNVRMMSSEGTHMLRGVQTTKTSLDNTQYGVMTEIMHNLGLSDVCRIDGNMLENINMGHSQLTEDWLLVVGDNVEHTEHGIFVKMVKNKLAIKMVHHVHTLLILPTDNMYAITLDGHKIEMENGSFSNDWLHYDDMGQNMLVLLSKHLGYHIVYNGDQLQIEMPRLDKKLMGRCFEETN